MCSYLPQYLNRTAFENITDKECRSRYSAEFIQVGSGIGIFNLSLEDNVVGAGNTGLGDQIDEDHCPL